jgi:UMF1 family MFS transporter
MIVEGFLLIVAANLGMEGGLVFYNSFLPRIAPREYQGRVSAWGFMVGYAGSILALVLALPLIQRGYFSETWLMIAVFFGVCSIPAFLFLPGDEQGTSSLVRSAAQGFRQALTTLREIVKRKEPGKFLLSYLIYEDGVSTVIVFSSIFAATTLGFQTRELILLYLAVQATALFGSLVMAKPIDLWGPRKVVMSSLVLWAAVATTAFFVETKNHFWVIATCAGLGLGTIQAASRAFYTQFVPEGKEAEYFGVYSLAGKSSAVIGPIIFGYVSTTFGSQRPAILSVAAFFIVGLIILFFVRGGGPNIQEDKRI